MAAAALVAVHRAVVASGRQPGQTTVKWSRPPVVSLIVRGAEDDVAYALSLFDAFEVDDAEVGEPFGGETRLVQVAGYVPALGVFLEVLARPS